MNALRPQPTSTLRLNESWRWGKAALLGLAFGLLSACSSAPTQIPPTPLTSFTPSREIVQVWQQKIGTSVAAQLSMAEIRQWAVAASDDGRIVAVNPSDGTLAWSVQTDGGIEAGVGASGNTLAVVSDKAQLIALRTTDQSAKEIWRSKLEASVLTPPLVTNKLIIVHMVNQHLAAFDINTGARRWSTERSSPSMMLRHAGALSLVGNQLVAGLDGGTLFATQADSGKPLWSTALVTPRGGTEVERLADVIGPMAISGDLICARSFQWGIGCVTNKGVLQWSAPSNGYTGLAADEGWLYSTQADGTVSAWQRIDGKPSWSVQTLAYRKPSQPALIGSLLAVGDFEGYLHFLSTENGSLVARLKLSNTALNNLPLLIGNTLLVQGADGNLTGLATR